MSQASNISSFEEETINISHVKDEIPGPVELLIPGQRINTNIEGVHENATTQFPRNLSVEVDSSLEEVTVSKNHTEDPTLEIWLDISVLAEDPSQSGIVDHIKEGNIEIKAHGLLNNALLFTAERTFLR